MKIVQKIIKDEDLENRDYRQLLTIEVDGVEVFEVGDGEPEDSNLGRDFNDYYKITDLMKMAWEAGSDGENLVVEKIKVEDPWK